MRISITLSASDYAAICQQAASKRLSASKYIVITVMQHIAGNPLAESYSLLAEELKPDPAVVDSWTPTPPKA